MNICITIVVGILVYVFLARVFSNVMFEKGTKYWYGRRIRGTEATCDSFSRNFLSVIFPFTSVVLLLILICKFPIKLADFATNPANYKFRIKFERK